MPDGFTSGELEILRGDLAAIFHEATGNTTEYTFDDSVARIEESAAGVEVQSQHGGHRRFALVVGGDGVHSKVRSVVFGDASQPRIQAPGVAPRILLSACNPTESRLRRASGHE